MTGIESANPMKSYQICVSLHQALGLGESFLPHETGDCWSGECQQLAQLDDNHGTKTWIPCDPLTSPLGVESKSSWAAFENSLWWPECSINSTALKAVESFKWCRAFHKTCSYDIYCYCNYVDYIGIYIYRLYTYCICFEKQTGCKLVRSNKNSPEAIADSTEGGMLAVVAVITDLSKDGWLADHYLRPSTLQEDGYDTSARALYWHGMSTSCSKIKAFHHRFRNWHDSRVFKLQIAVFTIRICHCRFGSFWTWRSTRPESYNLQNYM